MTRAHLPGSFRNSSNVVHIDTHRITLSAMEEDTSYPHPALPTKPAAKFELSLHQRAMTAAVAAMAVLAFILAVWPA